MIDPVSSVAHPAVPAPSSPAPAAPAPAGPTSSAPSDSVQISPAAKALASANSSSGDVDHDGDSH